MATWKTVCDTAQTLPGAELGERHGCPVWRVRGKVFVQLGASLRVPDEEDVRRGRGPLVMLHVSYEERAALVAERPGVFFFTPHYDTSPEVLVWLREAPAAQLRELVVEAWRRRASSEQRKLYDSSR